MIEFLLTNWWIYIPIIGALIFLTHRNNQKIKHIKAKSSQTAKSSSHAKVRHHKANPIIDFIESKLGLRGFFRHIWPRR